MTSGTGVSPEMRALFAANIAPAPAEQTFTFFLNDDARLRGRGQENGKSIIYTNEPQTSWWQRFTAGFMRMLPIRGQL